MLFLGILNVDVDMIDIGHTSNGDDDDDDDDDGGGGCKKGERCCYN